MSVRRRLLRGTTYTVLGFMAITVVATGGFWVLAEEPWYSNELIRQMGSGPYTAPWRDDTERAARAFPRAMSRHAATTYLARNGFSCTGTAQLDCQRKTSGLPCVVTYAVHLLLGDGDTVADVKANSYMACL